MPPVQTGSIFTAWSAPGLSYDEQAATLHHPLNRRRIMLPAAGWKPGQYQARASECEPAYSAMRGNNADTGCPGSRAVSWTVRVRSSRSRVRTASRAGRGGGAAAGLSILEHSAAAQKSAGPVVRHAP